MHEIALHYTLSWNVAFESLGKYFTNYNGGRLSLELIEVVRMALKGETVRRVGVRTRLCRYVTARA